MKANSNRNKILGIFICLIILVVGLPAMAFASTEVTSIKIKEEVVDSDDVEMLEDLVLSAVNEALKKAEEASSNQMGKLTGGLNIPGLF